MTDTEPHCRQPRSRRRCPQRGLALFGGVSVWLASVGAGGAVLGLLAAFLIMGLGDGSEFGQYTQVYCTTAGGQVVTNLEGCRFCAIWIDSPPESGG